MLGKERCKEREKNGGKERCKEREKIKEKRGVKRERKNKGKERCKERREERNGKIGEGSMCYVAKVTQYGTYSPEEMII